MLAARGLLPLGVTQHRRDAEVLEAADDAEGVAPVAVESRERAPEIEGGPAGLVVGPEQILETREVEDDARGAAVELEELDRDLDRLIREQDPLAETLRDGHRVGGEQRPAAGGRDQGRDPRVSLARARRACQAIWSQRSTRGVAAIPASPQRSHTRPSGGENGGAARPPLRGVTCSRGGWPRTGPCRRSDRTGA